jgi:alkanesulfonate monooxygenase SsuD/methylene tetrahydromethanopterin reductase-like flavin-dependent oxidoreductase (luciferase family)
VAVTPKPVQRPHPPLWMAATSEKAARRAARYGLNLLPQSDRRAAYEPWLDELAKLGRDPKEYRIGLIKSYFVTDLADDPVWAEARQRERYRWGSYQPWIEHGGGFVKPLPGQPEPINQQWIVGPPGKVIDEIERFREFLPVTDLISWGTPPGMDPTSFNPYLERFAKDVMPHFARD